MWQEEQRLSRFDDGAVRMRRQNEAVHSNVAAARAQDVVRSRVDAYYDPSHPDADWSGLVENRGKKKADPSMGREHIQRTEEGGIVAAAPYFAERSVGKKHYNEDGRFTTEPQRTRTEIQEADSPYVTAAQLAQRGVATDHEFRGAQTRRRGKKHVNPSFNRTPHAHPLAGDYVEPAAPQRPLTQSNVLMGATATADKQPFRAGSLAGYRSRQFAPGAKSMISATISGIAKSMPPPERTTKSDNGSWTSHNKEILDRDNYRPDGVLPGFTGTFRR